MLTSVFSMGADDKVKVGTQRVTYRHLEEEAVIGYVTLGRALTIQSSEQGALKRLAEALLEAERQAEELAVRGPVAEPEAVLA